MIEYLPHLLIAVYLMVGMAVSAVNCDYMWQRWQAAGFQSEEERGRSGVAMILIWILGSPVWPTIGIYWLLHRYVVK